MTTTALDKALDLYATSKMFEMGWLGKIAIAKMVHDWLGSAFRYSEYNRIRTLFGHLPPEGDKLLQAVLAGTSLPIAKPVQLGGRVAGAAQEEAEIQFGGDENFIEGYIDRGGRPTRRE